MAIVRYAPNAAIVLTLACGGVQERMRDASSRPCGEVVAQHASVAADPAYAAQPRRDRASYEIRVAQCALTVGQPDMAIAMTRAWPPDLDVTRAKITARAQAARGDEAATRATLETLAGDSRLDAAFFTDTPELRRFAGSDWFVRIALEAWAVRRDPPLELFAPRLVQNAGERLLPLSTASSDPTRHAGEWVMWTGIVREARLDREAHETLLAAEGVDVQQQLLEVERRAPSLKTRTQAFGTEATTDPKAGVEERTYQEVFVPNGRSFSVTLSRVDEAVAALHTITAFGRHRGRAGEGAAPVVDAMVVVERTPMQRTESAR